jgi:alanine dehydrogenase
VARSATTALTNAVLPWVLALAEKGAEHTLREHPELRRGTYLHHGKVVKDTLAALFGLPYEPLVAGR